MPNPRTLRISLAGIMALVAVAALFFRWPDYLYLAIPLAGYLIAERVGLGPRGRARLGILLCAIYLPCTLGFFIDCDHCRQTWLKLFPITPTLAPGLLATHFLGLGRLPDMVEFCIAAVVLSGLVAILAVIGRRGRGWLIGSSIFGLIWACFWAWVFSELLRS